jgi:hypothetical protein
MPKVEKGEGKVLGTRKIFNRMADIGERIFKPFLPRNDEEINKIISGASPTQLGQLIKRSGDSGLRVKATDELVRRLQEKNTEDKPA